jgi:hypothetical protein
MRLRTLVRIWVSRELEKDRKKTRKTKRKKRGKESGGGLN